VNALSFSLLPYFLILSLVAAWMVFCSASIRSFLMDFRYQELRLDMEQRRQGLRPLFQLLSRNIRLERILWEGPILWTSLWAAGWVVSGVILFQQAGAWVQDPLRFVGVFLYAVGGLVFIVTIRVWIPKRYAPGFSDGFMNSIAILLVAFSQVFFPIYPVLGFIRRFLGIANGSSDVEPYELDLDLQLLRVREEGTRLTSITEKITRKSLLLNSLCVYDILLPRNQVQYFDLEDPIEENIEKARKTGHTRFPLCKDDLDGCVGIIHIKDLFRSRCPLPSIKFENIVRPVLRFRQEDPLDKVLQELLHKRVHMALVLDEFGGVIGVVTLERILEELVGEIQDEFDKEEKLIVPLRKDFYRISGMAPLHEIEDQLGVENLENEEVSSLGGLITNHLGRIPAKGETFEIGPLHITILEQDETRVILAHVRVMSLP
jgi:CBS domain containing-hemolysin-like protein